MLKFFQSLFGNDTTGGNYPTSLVKAAIERAVDGTDPWIRAVSGYQKKLRPAVLRAIDYVVALVDGMAPAMIVRSGSSGSDIGLRTFFISATDMWKILGSDLNLAAFLRGQQDVPPLVYALLIMEKKEKAVLGAELSGDIVLRGVPQIAVSFDAHRLIDPAGSECETRNQLKRRAFDHLLSLALGRISIVKTERDGLERHRALLQSKLNLLRRGGWGFDTTAANGPTDVAGVEALLARIDAQMQGLGGDDRMLELYLDILIDVLGRPEEHLWAGKESLIIDRMGIKRSEAADDAPHVTLNLICDAEKRSLVASLVAIAEKTIRNNVTA